MYKRHLKMYLSGDLCVDCRDELTGLQFSIHVHQLYCMTAQMLDVSTQFKDVLLMNGLFRQSNGQLTG